MKLHALLLTLFAVIVSAPARADNALCLQCHDKGPTFDASIHGVLSCTDCHVGYKAFPHADNPAPVKCATCHAAAVTSVAGSVHANAGKLPCLNCHGSDPHAIVAVTDSKSPMFTLSIPETCGQCHGDTKAGKDAHLADVYSDYAQSIHSFGLKKNGLMVSATCVSCHGSHAILKSSNPKSMVNRANVPDTCGNCHRGIKDQYLSGIHGQKFQAGDAKVPVCITCHTAHEIADVNIGDWQTTETATCGECHAGRFNTYHDTFHSQVSQLNAPASRVARCWNCHGEHAILPKSNPKSMVNPANLVTTCGQCHHGANAGFVQYEPHADMHDPKSSPLLFGAATFMNLLLGGTLGFFALHSLLWFIREIAGKKEHGKA